MQRFSKRAIVNAIGAAFRAPFIRRPARPERRKPLFEALEPRILLSGEVPVIPPQHDQAGAVLSAPLEFGDSNAGVQVQQQGPQLRQFRDGWQSEDLRGTADGASLILDFSAVSGNLQFTILADGSVSVSDGSSQVDAANVVKLVGGAADDTFRFEKLPTEPLAIESGGRGTDRLDFSALHDDLTYVTHTDGTVTILAGACEIRIDRALATAGSQGRNTFVEEKAPVIAGTMNGGAFSAESSHLSIAAFVATQPAPKRIVIVDSAVQDYWSLLQDLPSIGSASADAAAGQGAEFAAALPQETGTASASAQADADTLIVVLDAGWDGVEQISQVLAAFQGLAAVHILSHGSSGSVTLGTATLNTARLESLASRLRNWGQAIAPGGDLLLYGCSVADGEAGIEFVNDLAALTGVDVAASTDLTGSAALGGDWLLEYSSGLIETAGWFGALAPEYAGLLATVHNAADGDFGSSQTIDLGAADTLNLTAITKHLLVEVA